MCIDLYILGWNIVHIRLFNVIAMFSIRSTCIWKQCYIIWLTSASQRHVKFHSNDFDYHQSTQVDCCFSVCVSVKHVISKLYVLIFCAVCTFITICEHSHTRLNKIGGNFVNEWTDLLMTYMSAYTIQHSLGYVKTWRAGTMVNMVNCHYDFCEYWLGHEWFDGMA